MRTLHANRIATGITIASLAALAGAFAIRYLVYGYDGFWNRISESQGIAALLGMLVAISPALWLWRTWMLTRVPASTRSARLRFVAGLLSYWALWLGLLQSLVMRAPFLDWFPLITLPVYLLLACAAPSLPWLVAVAKWLRGKRNSAPFRAPWFLSMTLATLISPLVLLYGGALYHSRWTPSFLQRPLVSMCKNDRCYTFEEGENTRWPLWHHVLAYWALPDDIRAWTSRQCLTPASTENTFESLAVIEAASRFYGIRCTPEVTALALDRSVNIEIRELALDVIENESSQQARRIALQIHNEHRSDHLGKHAARTMAVDADEETLIAAYSGPCRWEMCEGLFPRNGPMVNSHAIRSLLDKDLEFSQDPEEVRRLLTFPHSAAMALQRSRDSHIAIRIAVAQHYLKENWGSPDAAVTVLEQAMADADPALRATVVKGTCEIIQCLPVVRTAQLKTLDQTQTDSSPEVRATLAQGLSRQCYYFYYTPELKTLQASLLKKLAADPAPEVRRALSECLADPKQFEYMPEVRKEVQEILDKSK